MCGKTIENSRRLCIKCQNAVRYIKEPFCKKCGKQLDEEEKEYCADCKKRRHIYDAGVSVFAYNDCIRKSIYDFKYKDMKSYSCFYGEEMWRIAEEYFKEWQPEVIIPVPISEKRFLKRGYNQAELIAKELGKISGVKVDCNTIYRKKNTKPQKEIGKEARRKNLEKAFIIGKNVVEYKKVILVDDIYTTGSTIDECAKVLKDAGVEKVYFVSLSIGAGI